MLASSMTLLETVVNNDILRKLHADPFASFTCPSLSCLVHMDRFFILSMPLFNQVKHIVSCYVPFPFISQLATSCLSLAHKCFLADAQGVGSGVPSFGVVSVCYLAKSIPLSHCRKKNKTIDPLYTSRISIIVLRVLNSRTDKDTVMQSGFARAFAHSTRSHIRLGTQLQTPSSYKISACCRMNAVGAHTATTRGQTRQFVTGTKSLQQRNDKNDGEIDDIEGGEIPQSDYDKAYAQEQTFGEYEHGRKVSDGGRYVADGDAWIRQMQHQPTPEMFEDWHLDAETQKSLAQEMDAMGEAEVEAEVDQAKQRYRASRLDGMYWQGQWVNRDLHDPPYRQPRPHMPPAEEPSEKHIPALREHPMSKQWGGLIDIIEHETYHSKLGDADSGGGFHDFAMAPYDSESLEDPFYNNFLTEDEYVWPSDYEPQPYVPDSVRQQLYFLWSSKGWSIPKLGAKFKMRTERVSFIINLKRTEPECIAEGKYANELDDAMTQMYGRDYNFGDKDYQSEDDNIGLNVNVLKDDQLPDDVVPKMPWKGNVLKTGTNLPPIDLPPKNERKCKHRFAFKDISSGESRDSKVVPFAKKHLMVDHDGTRRVSTKREDLYRSNRARRFIVKRKDSGSNNWPFPDEQADQI